MSYNIEKFNHVETIEDNNNSITYHGKIKLFDSLLLKIVNTVTDFKIDFISNYGLGTIIKEIYTTSYIYDIVKDEINQLYLILTENGILVYHYDNDYNSEYNDFELEQLNFIYELPLQENFQLNKNIQFFLLDPNINEEYTPYFILRSGNFIYEYIKDNSSYYYVNTYNNTHTSNNNHWFKNIDIAYMDYLHYNNKNKIGLFRKIGNNDFADIESEYKIFNYFYNNKNNGEFNNNGVLFNLLEGNVNKINKSLVNVNCFTIDDSENFYISTQNQIIKYKPNKTIDENFDIFYFDNFISKMIIYRNNLFLLNENKLIVLDCDNGSIIKKLSFKNIILDFQINDNYLILYLDNYNLEIYKTIEKTSLKFNYKYIEKDINNNYYLNCNVTLFNSNNSYREESYNVSLKFRNQKVTVKFEEIPLTKNIYIPLDKELFTENKYYLDNYNVFYEIENLENNNKFSNYNDINNNSELISKMLFKDFYSLDNSLYFRMKYLNSNYNFLILLQLGNNLILLNRVKNKYINYEDLENNFSKILSSNEKYITLFDPKQEKSNSLIREINENIYNLQRVYNDLDNLENEYYWFKFNNLPISDREINIYLYEIRLNNSLILLENKKYTIETIRKVYTNEPLYKTIENDIKKIENRFLTSKVELTSNNQDQEFEMISNKDNYLKNNFYDIAFTKIINNNDFINIIDKEFLIDNIVNNNGIQLEFLITNENMLKENILIGNVFINGYKIPNDETIQIYKNNGILHIFIPVNNFSKYMSAEEFSILLNNIKSDDNNLKNHPFSNNTNIIIQVYKRKVLESEKIIFKYKLQNEDDIKSLISNGLNIKTYITEGYYKPKDLKLYIMYKNNHILKRYNPEYYSIEFNYDYKFIILKVKNSNFIKEGDTIYLISNGLNNGIIFSYNLDEKSSNSRIYSIPLTYINNDKELVEIDITKPEDLDIKLNGMTLYPYVDYNISISENSSIANLITFYHSIPTKGSKLEINLLNKDNNHTLFFKEPSFYYKESTNKITNSKIYVTLNHDDTNLFNKDKNFEVYINNKLVNPNNIKYINKKTIKFINIPNDSIKNIMIRFSYQNHTHNKDILDYLKYFDMQNNDSYNTYNIYYQKNYIDDNVVIDDFYSYCNKEEEAINTDSGKLLLLLKDYRMINCNENNLTEDCILDSEEIKNKYFKSNYIIDCNISKSY